jgi:hypothetical protein
MSRRPPGASALIEDRMQISHLERVLTVRFAADRWAKFWATASSSRPSAIGSPFAWLMVTTPDVSPGPGGHLDCRATAKDTMEEGNMNRDMCMLLVGMALGAGLMYIFDPQGGRRRQALIRDKAYSWANDAQELAEKKARHLGNKAQGMMAEARSMVGGQS